MTSATVAAVAATTRRVLIATSVVVACSGCATQLAADPRDPLESFNRVAFGFNDALDRAIIKPAATIYRDVTPSLVRAGVSNFLGNLDDVWSFVNALLQFNLQGAAQNFMRVHVNTLLGLGGVLDIATEMRIERQREDFGQTLGAWGVASGPYIVLPFFGPSTLRDVVAMPLDTRGDVLSTIDHIPTRNSFKALDLLDVRSSLLSAGDTLDQVAFDKYTFVRDAFLQRRRNAVYNGNPPDEPDGAVKAP